MFRAWVLYKTQVKMIYVIGPTSTQVVGGDGGLRHHLAVLLLPAEVYPALTDVCGRRGVPNLQSSHFPTRTICCCSHFRYELETQVCNHDKIKMNLINKN